MDEVCKAGKEAKSKKEVAAYGCCVKGLVGKIPTVFPVERWCHGGKLRYGSIVESLRNMFSKTAASSGRLSLSSRLTSFQDAGTVS